MTNTTDILVIGISGFLDSGFGMNADDVVALGASYAPPKALKPRQLPTLVARFSKSARSGESRTGSTHQIP